MSKKFIISEKEKSRISKIHNQRILMERSNINEEGEQQPAATTPPAATPQQPPAQQPPAQQPPTQQPSTRYKGLVCPQGATRCDQTIIRGQARMNDECPAQTLNDSLKPFYPSKYITGSEPNLKILEDGQGGKITNAAWTACKPKLTPTKQLQGTQTQGNTVAQVQGDVKTGEPITANDIATLTA